LVAIDKFTKWIEYRPITTLSADRVQARLSVPTA
jgi:hypothetical protein